MAEVNSAVNSIDQMTQQNAAMVEQSNAASNTLAEEAGRLCELIAQFDVGKVRPSALSQVGRAMVRVSPQTPTANTVQKLKVAASGGARSVDSWEEF